jgi:outer membrane protein
MLLSEQINYRISMMKKILLWYGLTFFASPLVIAQQTNFQSFSLKEAVQYALSKHPTIANARIDQQIATTQMKAQKAAFLPQINAGAELAHYPTLQKVFFQPNLLLPNSTDNAVYTGSLQVPYGGLLQINASQMIFNGAYLVGAKTAHLYTELASKAQQQTEEEVQLNVSKAYYNVLINQERIGLLEANIQRLTEALKSTEAALQNGIVEKIEVDRLTVLLNNATIEKDKFLAINDLGIALLKFQMNIPQEQDITVKEKLANYTNLAKTNVPSPTPNGEFTHISFELLATKKKIEEAAMKNMRAGYYPSAYLFGNLGMNTGTNSLSGLFTPTNWYNFTAIGLRIQVPIFDGFLRKHEIQQKNLQVQKLTNQEILLKNTLQLQEKQALVNLKNAKLSLQVHEQNIKLAQEILRIAQVKYKEGTNNQLELVNATVALKEAEMNYQQSIYEILLADLEVKKLYGLLEK